MSSALVHWILFGASLGATSAARQDAGTLLPSAATHLGTLQAALGSCDWELVLREAHALRDSTARASDDWFEATAALVRAHHERYDPSLLETLARDALSAAAELRLADPNPGQRPLDSLATARVVEAHLALAHLLQCRDLHHEALGHLRIALDDMERGMVVGKVDLVPRLALAAAWSQRALGRTGDASGILRSLRDTFPASHEAPIATVVLENDRGPAGYGGKYSNDPAHLRRLESLWAARTAADRRVADALGIAPTSLPLVLVGLADRTPALLGTGAFTEADPRRPSIPPVIVVFSEMMALGYYDPEQVLTHELCHAVPLARWGLQYDALPSWLAEALACALAGKQDALVGTFLTNWIVGDCEAYVREDFWDLRTPSFEPSGCHSEENPEAALFGLYLAEGGGPEALRRFVAEMEAGKGGQAAARAAYGLSLEELHDQAARHALARLRAAREETLPAVARLVRESGKGKGPTDTLAAVDRAFAEKQPSLVLGVARLARAEALETIPRNEEALAAWQAILNELPNGPSYAERARKGRAHTLIALGRLEEASEALVELRRDCVTPVVTEWVKKTLADLARSEAKR